MALVKPDFTEVKDDVTPGTYKAIIKGAEVKQWSSGDQYINWELETYGEKDPKNNGRKVFHKTSLSGPGAFQLQKLYKAATGQALKGEFDTEQLISRQVEIQVVDGVNRKTNEPTGYTEIKNVRPVTSN